MNRLVLVTRVRALVGIALCFVSLESPLADDASGPTFEVPSWLFPINPPAGPSAAPPPAPDGSQLLRVPNSQARFTRAEVRNLFSVPDWHPARHPPMPAVVAQGRKPSVYACGYCHLPGGEGRPENASLAGLPAQYIIRQVRDIGTHARRTPWVGPEYLPAAFMAQVAGDVADSETAEAAAYFSALTLRERRADVIETDRAPRMHVAGWMYVPTPGAGDEPLGARILEVARDLERHELRDAAAEYVAYVPLGSVERGRKLATTGDGRTLACAGCHGPELRGVGEIPPIAGRSPSYLMRQLVAFRTGARDTPSAGPMKLVVARLDVDEMIALAAYVGSVPP
jgi:cytochrome c553